MNFSTKFSIEPLPFPNLFEDLDNLKKVSPTSCYLVTLANRIKVLCDSPIDLKQIYSININPHQSTLVPSQHNMITDWSYGPQTIDLNVQVSKPNDVNYSLFPWLIYPKWHLIDFGTIDYILISNQHLITALPYITEYTNFKGQILATSPIKHFSRWLLTDLITHIPHYPLNAEKLSELGINYSKHFNHINPPFTLNDIEECLSKITWVTFNQRIPMSSHDPEDYFEAFSSGFQIGSCNWLIHTKHVKLGYISTSASLSDYECEFVNSDIDKTIFEKCDQILISNLHFSLPYLNTKQMDNFNYSQNLNELQNIFDEASSQMANVVFPVEMDGTLFNVLNFLYEWSKQKNRLHKSKFLFISKHSQTWAQLTHKCFEWVNQKNQNQYLFHASNNPTAVLPPISTILLEFSQWALSNLMFYDDVTTEVIQLLSNPNFQYIVFCDHPSFKTGRCHQLIKSMALYSAPNRSHSILFTDGRFDIEYFRESKFNIPNLRTHFLPLDYSMEANLIHTLIDHLPNPPQIFIDEHNAELFKDLSLKSHLPAPIKFLSPDTSNLLEIQSSHTIAVMEPALISSLSGKWLYHRQLMTSFQGLCNLENNHQIHLNPISSLSKLNNSCIFESPPMWATVSLPDLIEALNQLDYGAIVNESLSTLANLPSHSSNGRSNGLSNNSTYLKPTEENGNVNDIISNNFHHETYRLTFSGMASSLHRKDPCILIQCQRHSHLITTAKIVCSNRQLISELFQQLQKLTINFYQQ